MPIQLGSIALTCPVILAPMSGVTDLPFRRLARSFGADLVMSEMIASRQMVAAHRETLRMSTSCAEEWPMAVQLAGNEPDVMADAARMNVDRGAALIDINMGCPVKKVVKGHAGSALMRDEPLAASIIAAVVRAVPVPVTVKMRMGWDHDSLNAPTIARIAEDNGARMVTVHGRTRQMLYTGTANWAYIRQVKQAVSIPVVGNGDVLTADDARALLTVSGADGVMVGRGAQGRPWLPAALSRALRDGGAVAEPDLPTQRDTLLRHFRDLMGHYGRETGVRIARKHLAWATKGLAEGNEFRRQINNTGDVPKVERMIREVFARAIDPARASAGIRCAA